VSHPHPQGWSVNLEKDLGLARDTLQAAFFAPHFNDVVHGRATLRERLGPVLQEIAPHLSCDQLIEYFFMDDKIENVEAARKRQWHAAVWTGQNTLEELLKNAAQSARP
jgi:hypothetical protein